MRDQEVYRRAGRNDPYSDAQMLEHPYDFVSLPDRPAKGEAVGHDRYPGDRWTGLLRLVYRTESPLHVGSGVFEFPEECGLNGRSPVRGIVRSRGEPVLPGSSWKGAVRARFEAITASTLTLAMTTAREPAAKVPGALYQGNAKNYRFEIADRRVLCLRAPKTVKTARRLETLSPADALFGCLGYRGRVLPAEGRITGPTATEPLRVAPLDSPQMHRLAPPGGMEHAGGPRYRITKVEGRKFYYDGDVVHYRTIRGRGGERRVSEEIDHVPSGCEITLEVRLVSVTKEELGALLVSAGYGEEVGVVRFGGYKPAGLGKVRLESAEALLHRGHGGRRWRRASPEPFDLEAVVASARSALLDLPRLRELHQVTTLRRPAT